MNPKKLCGISCVDKEEPTKGNIAKESELLTRRAGRPSIG